MNSGPRVKWPASECGPFRGGKPTDNVPTTGSRNLVDWANPVTYADVQEFAINVVTYEECNRLTHSDQKVRWLALILVSYKCTIPKSTRRIANC
jgi:hypothetical protein